jgi:hypothetical protein
VACEHCGCALLSRVTAADVVQDLVEAEGRFGKAVDLLLVEAVTRWKVALCSWWLVWIELAMAWRATAIGVGSTPSGVSS